MRELYDVRGGKNAEFDCDAVRLDLENLAILETTVRAGLLPETYGFFFGESQPEHKELDLGFIVEARKAIAEGYSVFYNSWW